MSMKRNTARRVIGTAMLAAGVLLFTSCPREVGLGSAVDTQKPVVSITTPDADSVVRGNVTLTGNVTDDRAVKSVTVTFTSTSQPGLASKTYPAKVDEKTNTWTLVVNTTDTDTGLTDSNYEIIVTASDTSNKTSTATRSIQLDNTAPTVLITSPSLYGTAANRTKFCSQLEIKGEAYDASKIQKVQVTLCDAAGTTVAGPLTADGTNTWSAMFASSDLTALQDNVVYYFYATATDESGNINSTFYHKADIYGKLPQNSMFPSVNDIGHLDQRTAASDNCQLNEADLLSVRIETGAAGISARLAAGAGYPDFTYQSQADAAILWTNLGDDSATSIIGVNSAVFATIQPPTDNSAIKLDTIEIKIRTKNGSVDGPWIDQTSMTKQKVGESVNISVSPKSAEGQALQEGNYEVSLSCSTNSNAVISSNKVFQIQSDAPVVEESSVGSGSAAFAQGIRSDSAGSISGLSGKFLRSNREVIPLNNLSQGSFVISCKNSAGTVVSPNGGWFITTNGTSNDGAISYNQTDGTWSLPIPISGQGAFINDTYTFSISGTLGEAGSMVTRVVVVDTMKPEVNLVSPTSNSCITISDSGAGFTLQGSAMDEGSGILATYWCIDTAQSSHNAQDSGIEIAAVLGDGAVPVTGNWYKFSTPTVFNLMPNMSGYEQKDYKFFLISKDQAGHFSDVTVVPFFIDNTKPELSVTSWPALTRQNANGMTISGKAWDSSGALEKVYVSFDGGAAVVVQDVSSGAYTSGSSAASWTFPGSAVIPAASWTDGTHTLAFSVKDKAGRTSDVVTNTFIIDNVAPDITVANLTDGQVFTGLSTPISGTAIDSLSGIAKVQYSQAGDQTTDASWHDAENSTGAWSINLGTLQSEDTQKIRVRAIDNAGNIGYAPATGDITFSIDKANPKAEVVINAQGAVTIGDTLMTKNGNFTLNGIANDAQETAGREAQTAVLSYTKDGESPVTLFDSDSHWTKGTENGVTGKWTYDPQGSLTEGFYTFTLTVTDTVGKSTTVTKSFRYDSTAPVLNVDHPAANESFTNADIAMSGTVSDSGSGVDKLYYTLDGTNPTTSSDTITPNGNSWTKNFDFNVEGVKTLKMYAVDKLGNKSEVKFVTFSRDSTPPTLTVAASIPASGFTTNNDFTLTGTAADTNGLASITITAGTQTWTGDGTSGDITWSNCTTGDGQTKSCTWSLPFTTDGHTSSIHFDDGTQTFIITAKDVAGKTVTATRTVTVDTSAPTISGVTLQNTLVSLDESKFDRVTVNAADVGTGLAGVYYQVLGATDNAPTFDDDTGWTSLSLASGNNWASNIDFTSKAEGEYKIYAAAKDAAGNRTLYGTVTSVTLDEKKPVVKVMSGDTAAGANNVTLTVRVTDTNADSVVVEVAGSGKTATAPSIGTAVTGTGYKEWPVTIPVSEYADGFYTITLTGKDANARLSTPVTHTICRDTTPPAVSIVSPVAGKTGINALFGSSYLFQGTATDNDGGSGLAKILYAFTETADAPASWTELAMTDGSWSITRSLNEGKTPAATGNLYEGTWYLHVIAEDKAGNRVIVANRAVRSFDIDMSNPTANVTKIDDSDVTDLSKTQYTGSDKIKFTGTGSDTNGIKSRKITIDGTDYDLGTTNGGWTYEYSRTDANKDKLLTATVTVTDTADKTSTESVSFWFDTIGPEVTITKPVNDNEAIVVNDQNKYTISGTAEDSGIGVDTANATYLITDTESHTVASGALNVPGASWNQTVDFTGKAEGSLTLKVTIQDKLGHAKELTKPFYYDKADPVLENINISASGLTTNANFTLEGYAWDSNDIDCITVTDGTHTWSSGVSPATVTLDSKDRTAPGAADSRNWHINFVVGSSTSGDFHIDDGTTTFTITAKDVAGKTITQTRTVTVDTSVPEIISVTPASSAEIPAGMVYLDVSAYKKITVVAKDEGSGLAGVYYKVVTAGSAAPTFTSEDGWTALALSSNSGSSSTWTAEVNFSGMAEGNYSIYTAAKDNAGTGNRAVYGTATAVTVDAKKPVTTVSGASDAGNENVTLTVVVEDTNPNTPVITVLKPKDDGSAGGSALASPALSISSPTAVTGGKKWTVTVPFGNATYNADGVYTVVVNETDANGRTADEKTHTIRRDTTAPTVSIVSPVEGKTGINALFGSSYLFQGTATDNDGGSGLAKILYAFTETADAPTSWTELAMTDGSWSITRSLNEGKAATATGNLYEGTWYLHVIAEDKAGNRVTVANRAVRSFDIDMNPPSLDITKADGNALSDLTKTYYSKTNKLKLEGTATDTNGITLNSSNQKYVTLQIDSETPVTVQVGADGSWTYEYTRNAANKDILHTVTVTAVDAVGKSAVKTVPFYFDTTAPSVTITMPVADEITSSNTYTLSGTVADVGSGVAANPAGATYANAKAKYIIKKGSETVASGPLTITGASWKAENVQLGADGSEGKLDLTISIKDELDWEATATRTFYKDLNPPELHVLSVSTSGLTTRDNFKIGGTAWDTNELDSITITDGTNTWTSTGTGATINLVKKTADPGDDESKWNWYMNFDVDGTTGYTHVADGTKTYTITAKDVAGKTVTETRTVTVDRTPPSITAAATTAGGGVAADKVFQDVSVYKPLTVTATDAGTGLTAVYYQIVTPATQSTTPAAPEFTASTEGNWTSLALTGSDSWSGNADFTGKAEGRQYIFVAAKDKVGNRAVYETAVAVTVDATKPVISISGVPSQGQTDAPAAPKDAGASDVKFIVYIADTNPTAPVITVKDTAGNVMASPALDILDPVVDATGKKWTVTVPFGNTAYETDGFYTIIINETDDRGRAASEITHKIRKDTTAPAAAISTPAADRTGANALFGDSYRFTGTAADNTDGSGLAKILYAFTASGDAPATWTELIVTDENWTISQELISGTAASPAGKLSEGTWYLHILAEDNAGNRTAVEDRAVRKFDIDLNTPELAVTKADGKELSDLTKTNYTKNNSIKLAGTASDTNGVTSVTVKVGDEAAKPATYTQAAGTWEYTYTRTNDNKDQLLTATVTVTDVAGKTAVKTVPFYFDTQAPTVSITQPAPDEKTSSNTYTISGTVADVGSGVATNPAGATFDNAKAKYEIKNGAETVAKGLLPVTGANWSATVDLDDNSLAKKEGELTLTIWLEDTLGNKPASPITRTFYYDKTPPAITENGVGASLTTKEAFTFSGQASDTNALAGNGIGAIQVSVVKGTETVATDTIDVDGSGAWSKTFTPGSSTSTSTLTDGTFSFTFTVTDVAGRTAMTTSSVTIDRSAPVIGKADALTSFITDTPTTDGNWFKKEYLALKAKVTDTAENYVVASGVSMVEYAVISNPAAEPDEAAWKNASVTWNTMTMGASSVCTANAQVAGGTNYICIRATDVAGNVTYSTQEMAKVDLSAPAITGVYTDAQCSTALSNNTYMTSRKDLVLFFMTGEAANTGTPVQTGSGIKEFKVTINGHVVDASEVAGSNGKYVLSVMAENLDAYLGTLTSIPVSAVISDKAGNSTSVSQLFTIQYDKTAPAVVFKTPAAGTTVNKTISVTGTASDDQSLESVILYKGDFTGATAPAESDKLTAFTGNDRYSWTYSLNTFDNTSSPKTYVATTGSMTLTVIASDTAGNVTKEKVSFSVDQTTDIPEISFNNIAMNGMTSSAPVRLTSGKTIYGSVTDDDGAVKKLEISTDGKDISAADKAWQELTVSNGSFTTVVNNTDYLVDGSYTIQFRVTDKEDTVFTTSVLKGSDDAESADGNLYLIVDTTNPVAPTPKFSLTGTDSSWTSDLLTSKTFSKSLPSITTDAEAAALPADVGADTFWIQQTAYDANGIDKVEVAIGNDTNYTAATPVLNGDGTRKTDADGYDVFKYQVTHDQIAAASSGTQTIYIKVTDNVGKEQTVNANFSVDNDAPAIEVSSHTQNEHVKGEFYVGGTSNDAPKNKGAKTLVYKVTESATRPSDWTVAPVSNLTYAAHEIASDNLASWRIYFDNDFANDGYAHDRTFKQVFVSIPAYADYLMVTSEQKVVYSRDYNGHHANDAFVGPNNGYVQLYIHFKATDAFGNTSYTSIPLMFDPQGDIPSVAISYPGATAYGWQHTTVSGQTRTADVIYTAKQTNLKAGDPVYKTLDAVIKNVPDGQITEVDTANNKINATVDGTNLDYTWFGGACIQGGVIRVQGTALAEGANKISGVYLQIDPTYDPAYGFQWTNDGTAGSELMPYGGMTEAQRPADKKLSVKYTPVAISDSLKGISVGSTGAWSISLNESGEFDSADEETSNMIAVRAVVKDDKNNVSPITDAIIITVDSDTPRIGASEPLVLRQYSDNAAGTGTVTAEQEYTDDMWLKGEWWLEGSVEDKNGITELKVAGTSIIAQSVAHTWNAGLTSKSEGYKLHYKIGNTTNGAFGTLTYKISAKDGDTPPKEVEKTISVRYDNKAPVLEGVNDSDYNIKQEVVQKNGFYTLGSGVLEAGEGGNVQSGFERLALYFVRRGTGSGASATVDRLFDTYFVKKSVDGNTNNELALSGLRYDTTDNLYYLQNKTVGHSGNSDKITLSAADANIHKGGMVKIRDAYYIIKDMSADGKTITLDRALADLGATETAQFALAMIVDNTQTEKAGTLDTNGYYKPSNSDDGDCMLESVNTSNGTTVWEANINSRNIPDGAIEIHYVAFDKAGNSAHGVVNGTVANNAPRLAGVRYGVDNNGDGNVSDSELKDKLFAMDNGKYIDSDLKTSYILKKSGGEEIQDDDAIVKIKGAVKVIPEIVGGNGDLYYTWSVTEDGAAAPYYAITTTSPLKNGTAQISGSDYTGKGLAEEIKEAGILLTMKDLLKGNIKDGNAGKNQVFTFTIWDSTEGMTPGSLAEGVGSQRAVIKMVADVKLKDDAKPSAVISPFYWQNKNSNSVYRTTDENENTIMQGHIDLSADLPAANFPTSTASGALDRDDKVSGAIVIEGTATDDTLLSGLYMKIYSGTGTNQFAFTGVNAITANDQIAKNTKPASGSSPLVGYYKVASYNGSWTGSDFYTENGWKFEAGNDEFDENGHTTHWKLTLNTEKLSSTVIADLKVSVLATDMGAPTLSGETITYKENVNTAAAVKSTTASPSGMYQFDVVPYIRSMKTSISESAGAEFARSATGRYSVRNGEEVKVYGWNLDTGTQTKAGKTEYNTAVSLGDTALAVTAAGTDEDGTYVTAKIGSTSGNIKVSVSGIDSLNNLNSNDAAGMHTDSQGNTVNVTDANYATYAYNRVPNGVTNNRLSDDVSIWVWDFGAFVDSTNITSPMMKMGPDSKFYMSYGNGIQQMMVNLNGTHQSVDYSYNKFHNTNVAFDASGRIWAVAMNTDRIRDDSSRYVLYAPLSGTMPTASGNDSTEYRASSDTKRHLELAYNDATKEYDINRTKNAKLITETVNGNTIVATSYYDANNTINPIKVRFGTMGYSQSATKITFTWNNSITTYGWYSNTSNGKVSGWTVTGTTDYSNKYLLINGTYYKLTRTSYYEKRTTTESYYYTIEGYSGTQTLSNVTVYNQYLSGGITGQISDGVTSSGSTPTITMTQSNDPSKTDSSAKGYHIVASEDTTIKGGAYTAVGIVPSNKGTNGYVGVIAWYDAQAKKLAFSYNTDPDSAYVASNSDNQWMKHAFYVDSSAYTGWYVDMIVDDDGGIHLAYYDSGKGDLKYAYLSSFEDTTADVVTVDSYLSVGTDITINIREENGRQVPYIYYYNASATQTTNSVRVAWQENATLGAGAVSDKFTGNWEVMTIPTAGVPVDATVCGGVPTSGTYANKVVLGYMTDTRYERAVLQK